MLRTFLLRLKMSQEAFNAADTAIKIIGLLALVISGVSALQQYREGQEREYKKVFYERQLTTVAEVFSVITEIDLSTTPEAKRQGLTKFWMIYQGSGRTFLSPKMFESLSQLPLDYVSGCVAKLRKPRIIQDCNLTTGSQSVAGFALVAREEMARTWSHEFKTIGAQDPWLPE